jgi:hypothetical protein
MNERGLVEKEQDITDLLDWAAILKINNEAHYGYLKRNEIGLYFLTTEGEDIPLNHKK